MEPFSVTSYVVREKIGEGAMGEVYRAVHRATGREVALKRVVSHTQGDPGENSRALITEFRTLAALHHPHIVSVLDYGVTRDGVPTSRWSCSTRL